jgi:hypothetical protein
MRPALDAVQNVKPLPLTGGYRNNFPLFHKVFHRCVEKSGRGLNRAIGSSGHRVIESQKQNIYVQEQSKRRGG